MSEHPERFFVAEIIREKVFQLYQEEVPYCTTVRLRPSLCLAVKPLTGAVSAKRAGPPWALLKAWCPCELQVQITDFKERDTGKDLVSATVFVEQESQKGIVIGRGGSALKQLGTAARADIEAFLGETSSHMSAVHPPAVGY